MGCLDLISQWVFQFKQSPLWLTGSHKTKLQSRCTKWSSSLPTLSLSLSSSSPFHNKTLSPQLQHSLTTAMYPPPLIFCPSLLRLYCARSLCYQEGWRCFKRFPSPPSSWTPKTHTKESQTPNSKHNLSTQVSYIAHLSHLQLVNSSQHYGSAEEKFVSPLLVWSYFLPFSWFCLYIS